MTCTGCGFDAPPDFAFCLKCGTKCPSAPTAVAERSPASTALESDRRLVTVLFADLSGFTALSEQPDPEGVRSDFAG